MEKITHFTPNYHARMVALTPMPRLPHAIEIQPQASRPSATTTPVLFTVFPAQSASATESHSLNIEYQVGSNTSARRGICRHRTTTRSRYSKTKARSFKSQQHVTKEDWKNTIYLFLIHSNDCRILIAKRINSKLSVKRPHIKPFGS